MLHELKFQAEHNPGLVGQLNIWPLGDLLTWLNQTGRSAMIRIGGGLSAGVIFIKQGHLVRCEWGHLRGEEAVFALLSLQEGMFSLLQRDGPQVRKNITTPVEQLLLQFAIAKDEEMMRSAS